MKIGIIKEEKVPQDKRVPLTPLQCVILLKRYPFIEIVVQSSLHRCFSDEMYVSKGINVVEKLDDCDILLGIKEVPVSSLIAHKTYLFFSHTIKEQIYNRALLLRMIELDITMIDYEVLKDKEGRRLLGFGRYAGIVGAYNGLLSYGLKSERYRLKPAYKCSGREQMENQLQCLRLSNEKIIVTGNGRAGRGAVELLERANIRKVSKAEFISKEFNEPVFVHLDALDYNTRKDGRSSSKDDFYNNPKLYKSVFTDFTKYADIFIAAHYYSISSPFLFTREDMRCSDFNLKVIADISCDINGPVPATIRSSTILNPIFGYNPIDQREDDYMKDDVIAVMAVDNLPCELPKDASEDFGEELLDKVIPLLLDSDKSQLIHNATICKDRELTPNFGYLRGFVNNI